MAACRRSASLKRYHYREYVCRTFVEYRDPHAIKAELAGVICISDLDETTQLKQFVDNLTAFMIISQLPSAVPGENDSRGFENTFEAPDFNEFRSVHGP
jgi:peptidase M49-like protein